MSSHLANSFSAIPIESCYGIGATIAPKLHKLNIHNAWDLLTHFPRSYENRSQLTPFSTLQIESKCLCQGIIYAVGLEGRKRNILRVSIKEQEHSTHILQLKFFRFSVKQARTFKNGQTIRCFGTIKAGTQSYEMIHPEMEFVNNNASPLPDHLIAIYPSSEGLMQFRLRNAINPLLNRLQLDDTHQDDFQAHLQSRTELKELNQITISQAIYHIHRPTLDASIEELEHGKSLYFQRLSIEELTAHRLGLKKLQHSFHQYKAINIKSTEGDSTQQQLLNSLPFKLTDAQHRCYREIAQAMQQEKPMMHLLQGDVGSGKTLVATLVILNIIKQNAKAMFMVPTELLATQHYQTLHKWLTPLNIQVNFLCGKQTAKHKREVHAQLCSEQASITVGTHALFQEQIQVHNLALIIIDEQHRFGVQQRFNLLTKSQQDDAQNTIAHQLLISATPIPRTLSMSLYGELTKSTLDEMPQGRQSIETSVMSNASVMELSEKIGEQCRQRRQVYWVCPFIEESELLNVQSATQRYEQLTQQLSDINIGLMHGKLKEAEKQDIMEKFRLGEIQLLVATTVIEVGVDVPNASIIIVENAERMGLAQLHQLRGRVGRGDIKSQCIYLYQAPISEQSIARLNALKNSNDGFYLAEQDLQMRGAGEVIGHRQSGTIHFKVANLIRDQHLIPAINEISEDIHAQAPKLEQSLLQHWNFLHTEFGKV